MGSVELDNWLVGEDVNVVDKSSTGCPALNECQGS
jgi:hypothetical protein